MKHLFLAFMLIGATFSAIQAHNGESLSNTWGMSFGPWSMGDCGVRTVIYYDQITGEEITRFQERKPCTEPIDPIGQ